MTGGRAGFQAIIHGRVQGVGFRWFVLARGRALELRGGVRNRHDGTVEVNAEGPRQALEQMIKDLNEGPLGSSVERVEVQWLEFGGSMGEFEILPSR